MVRGYSSDRESKSQTARECQFSWYVRCNEAVWVALGWADERRMRARITYPSQTRVSYVRVEGTIHPGAEARTGVQWGVVEGIGV